MTVCHMLKAIALWVGLSFMVAGCSFTQLPQATPTLIPVTLTASPSPLPSVTLTPTPATILPTPSSPFVEPTPTSLPPSETPPPSPTPGPIEHVIQTGETLGYIVQLYGHRSFDVIAEVVRMNDNIPNADILPPPGTMILVPRPTVIAAEVTPNPVGPALVVSQLTGQPSNSSGLTTSHIVQEGETMVDIAQQYNTTLEILSQLNSPGIPFFGCNFNIPSGGPDCIIVLQVGQAVNVPAPTPTPTLSPTPSGNETATPTPTHSAPLVVFPPKDAVAAPGVFALQWVSSRVLASDEVYLVQIQNITLGLPATAFITRSNSFSLPPELIPRGDQTQQFQWSVGIARLNAAGRYELVGSAPPTQQFQWQGVP